MGSQNMPRREAKRAGQAPEDGCTRKKLESAETPLAHACESGCGSTLEDGRRESVEMVQEEFCGKR